MWKNFLSIFKSSTGNYDMGRILSFKTVIAFTGAFEWAVFHNHQAINWAEAGAGYAAMLAGVGALIAAKEVAVAKAGAIANGS